MKLQIVAIMSIFLMPLFVHAEVSLQPCNEKDIKGMYNLIIYSNSFINDPETFIVLDRADDGMKILPYAPAFKYSVKENLDEKEALKIAGEILKDSSIVSFVKCSTIRDKENIYGYELKPVYFPWIFGILEPLETVYKKQGSTITIFIRLHPQVERQIYFDGDSGRDGNGN